MKHFTIVRRPPHGPLVSFADMKPGQIGIIREANFDIYLGEVVIRGYDTVLSLDGMGGTWGDSVTCNKVEILPPGSRITLEVTE